jgi:hypothetical protein
MQYRRDYTKGASYFGSSSFYIRDYDQFIAAVEKQTDATN